MLHKYLTKYERYYGLNIQLVVEDETLLEFPIEVGIQVIRVIQEALINVRKLSSGRNRTKGAILKEFSVCSSQ